MPYKNRAAQNAYHTQRNKARRQKWIDDNGPCANCGSTENLQVDHIDPAQKITHRFWSYTEAKRQAELAKCQVLCATCNNRKNIAYLGLSPWRHGTSSGYKNHGCRCRPCTTAATQDRARLKREKRQRDLDTEAR